METPTKDVHPVYEYTTRQYDYLPGHIRFKGEDDLVNEGWERVWADINMTGVFAVYRRITVYRAVEAK